tara:strand:+ start:1406 stop:2026 length:621 start_codon:yes stop_codon:yes gene_type:complete
MNNKLTDMEIDTLAIKLLEYYNEGEFSYEEGVNKSVKQKNLKRSFKQEITELVNNKSKSAFTSSLHCALMSLLEPDKLRKEIKTLRQKNKHFEDITANGEALAMTLYKDEIYKQVKAEKDKELIEDLQGSREVNRKLMDVVSNLERCIDDRRDYVPRETLLKLEEEHRMQLAHLTKNKKLTKKEKKIAELKKQVEMLEDDEDEDDD